jgi:large subunit ribosomal protein L23
MAAKKVQKNKEETKVERNPLIQNPRITEKATVVADNNVYTFDVSTSATKPEIVKTIKALYKVTPVKVNILKVPSKAVFRKGKKGTKSGGKKAYVFLKKGDSIEFA